jgi:hypothetical protein
MNKEDIVIFKFSRDETPIGDVVEYYKNIKDAFDDKIVVAIEDTMGLYDIHGNDLSDHNRELLEEAISKFE